MSDPGFIEATDAIDRIATITEDKSVYDIREKRLRDQKWLINSAMRDSLQQGIALGELVGQIVLLQRQLGLRVSTREELLAKDTRELNALISELEPLLRNRQN